MPVGQAQAWFGDRHAVLWDCYYHEREKVGEWQAELQQMWRIVEKHTGATKLFTLPQDPDFAEGYQEFLQELGYRQDDATDGWWGKTANAIK